MYQYLVAAILALIVLSSSGCLYADVERLEMQISTLTSQQQKRLEELNQYQKEMEQLRMQVNDGLTLALCTPEIRQLLEDVQRECVNIFGLCTTKQIRPAVISADPEHRGRFLKLMSHLPHEVVYLGIGASEIDADRAYRLSRLIRPALLKSTLFLVVSSPEGGEAEAVRRAERVERLLLNGKLPPAKIRRWLYGFPVNKADILRQRDLPAIGETMELHRGVWIFRADC